MIKRSKSKNDAVVKAPTKKVCVFCTNKTEPTYTDSAVLRKLMNDRSRIVAKMRTGTCSKHQRRVSLQIKYARHLAILPFVAKV